MEQRITEQQLKDVWHQTKRDSPSETSWLILADALEEAGHRRLARRVAMVHHQYMRLKRTRYYKKLGAGQFAGHWFPLGG